MNKRYLLAILLSFVAISAFGQSLNKMIEDAVAKGTNGGGVYRINNPKYKDISAPKACKTLDRKGYIPLYWDSYCVERFGGVSSVFDYVVFTSDDEYDNYKYSKVGFRGVLSDLKNKGSFYIAKTDIYKGYDRLIRMDGAMWSGEVKDGLLEGYGYGLIDDGKQYLAFIGTFVHGLPYGKTRTNSLERYLSDPPRITSKDYSEKNYLSADDEVLISNIDSDDQQLRGIIRNYAKEKYPDYVNALDDVYQQVKPVSMTKYDQIAVSSTPDLFKRLYSKAGYDPQGKVSQAEEILAVYGTVAALKAELHDEYTDDTTFWGLTWLGYLEKADRAVLSNGLSLSEQYLHSKYGFSEFFKEASVALRKKNEKFEQRIKTQRKQYDNEVAMREKRRKSAEAEQRARYLAQHGHEVDESRSFPPSGKIEYVGGIFYYSYANEKYGEVHYKNGHFFRYYIIYEDEHGTKVKGYKVVFEYGKGGANEVLLSFGGRDDMMWEMDKRMK